MPIAFYCVTVRRVVRLCLHDDETPARCWHIPHIRRALWYIDRPFIYTSTEPASKPDLHRSHLPASINSIKL